jgi:GntR family transcriptional regulator
MEDAPGFRPLYRQVYDYVVKQLTEGAWKPGEALPSEQALAAKLRVSQGTVRKALDALAQEALLDRQQGKGTFVSLHTQEKALFRFFRLVRINGGGRGLPSSQDESIRKRGCTAAEAAKLGIETGDKVYEVTRTRLLDAQPVIFEKVVVPAARFPDLDRHMPPPNALYQLYQSQYETNIVSTDEQLHADLAGLEDSERLRVDVGSPLLVIERVATALDGARVELRTSRCDTRRHHYAVSLR